MAKTETIGEHYRQGDLLFIRVKSIPTVTAKGQMMPHPLLLRKPDRVVIEGEVTGHKHQLRSGELMLIAEERDHARIEAKQAGRVDNWNVSHISAALRRGAMGYAVLEQPTTLEHPEHDSIDLPAGIYEIRRQRMWMDESQNDVERARFVND